MKTRSRSLASLLLLLLAGCASTGGARTSTGDGASDRLTRDQLLATQVQTAYDGIQRLRPTWLRRRGNSTFQGGGATSPAFGGSTAPAPTDEPVVYVDGVRSGGVEVLRSYHPNQVTAIEFLDGPSATLRFGTGNTGGAILVSTR